ncbi:hypothetical protein GGI12_000151 [Dipsacomyces acuminosporus]|nr:hypothetical protein GGI12_000151 [Dipsacomyces acuminosporus]
MNGAGELKRKLEELGADPAVKRPACTYGQRSSVWTDAEKERVFEKIQKGKASVAEIARHVGNTKSLRQVAEYIEYMQFWSTVIASDSGVERQAKEEEQEEGEEHAAAFVDNVDSDGKQDGLSISDEERDALAAAESDDREMLQKSALYTASLGLAGGQASAASRKYSTFNARFGNLLAKLVLGDDNAQVVPTTFIHMYIDLVLFLRKVLVQVAVRSAATANADTSYVVPRLLVKKKHVLHALRSCGFDRGKPPADLFATLVGRYLGEGFDPTDTGDAGDSSGQEGRV